MTVHVHCGLQDGHELSPSLKELDFLRRNSRRVARVAEWEGLLIP
jgi:hypothetical protein